MKIVNISPLSLVILLSFINQQEVRSSASERGEEQGRAHQKLDSFEPAYRSTGPVPISHQAYLPSAPVGYPPSYCADDRRGPEWRTPPSGYYSDQGLSHHSQFPPSPGYSYPPHHSGHPYPPYPPQAGPLWIQSAQPACSIASLPPVETKRGHVRQRSNTFSLGDLSLETDTDETDGVKEIPVPRQLQDSVGIFTTERDLLIAAAQNFLGRAKEEGKAIIEGFNTINAGDASPGERRRDSTFEKLAKGLRSADKNAEKELTQKCKNLDRRKKPYEEQFLCLAAQCTVMKDALEDATRKLTLEKAEPK